MKNIYNREPRSSGLVPTLILTALPSVSAVPYSLSTSQGKADDSLPEECMKLGRPLKLKLCRCASVVILKPFGLIHIQTRRVHSYKRCTILYRSAGTHSPTPHHQPQTRLYFMSVKLVPGSEFPVPGSSLFQI